MAAGISSVTIAGPALPGVAEVQDRPAVAVCLCVVQPGSEAETVRQENHRDARAARVSTAGQMPIFSIRGPVPRGRASRRL